MHLVTLSVCELKVAGFKSKGLLAIHAVLIEILSLVGRSVKVKRKLLAELMARCEAVGIRKIMAIVGDSANAASVGVHLALGFEQVGKIDACGWKFGAWRDIVIMQKSLGLGDTQPPVDMPR